MAFSTSQIPRRIKKSLFFLLLAGAICFRSFAQEANQAGEIEELSYAFGMVIASDIKYTGLELDYSAFDRGFKDFLENLDTRFTLDEALYKVETAIRLAMAERAELNHQEGERFLAQNAAMPGIYTTASGLQYEIIVEGSGRQPQFSDFVRVHYTGFLIDGTIFDSSYERGEPEEFPLQAVIPGWSEGLQLMREGGKNILYIPSRLAYGIQGAGNFVPPNSVIIFEVELLNIIDDPPPFFWNEDNQ